MRTMALYIPALFVFFAVLPAVAQVQGIEIQVERRSVTLNAPFNIIVTLQGGDISRIIAPEGKGIVVDQHGRNTQQSTRIQLVNGNFSQISHQVWIFTAKVTEAGRVTIPPFRAIISGQEFFSNTIELDVGEGSESLDLNPNLGKREKWDAKEPSGAAQIGRKEPTLEDIVYIGCELDRSEVYQGELVMLRLRLGNLHLPGSRAMIRGARSMPAPPSTEGFYRGPDDLNTNGVFEANGFEYRGVEYYIPLYPTHSGEFEIGPWVWEGTVQGHVSGRGLTTQTVRKATPVAKVKVKPLPDRPSGFSGAVGTYDFRVRVQQGELRQGVPVDLQITVAGYGNPDAIGAIKIPQLGWATVSAPIIHVERPDAGDWAFSKRVFTYKLTPTVVGQFIFPGMEFVYFDPHLEEYKTRSSVPFDVVVGESEESNQLVTMGGQTRPKAASEMRVHTGGLAPPIRDAGRLRPATGGGRAPLNTVAFGFPVLAYACCAVYVRRRRHLEGNPRYARYALARKRSREQLAGLGEHPDPASVLFKTVAGFVADRLGASAEGLTSADVKALLRERGVAVSLSDTFVRILRKCEQVRFAGGTLRVEELHALRDAAEDAMDELECITERGGRT